MFDSCVEEIERLGIEKFIKKTIVSVSLLDPKRIERKFYFDFYLGKFEMGVAEN